MRLIRGAQRLAGLSRSRYTEVQRGDRGPSKVVVAEVTFALDADDKAAAAAVAPDVTGLTEFVLYRYLDNRRKYNFGTARLCSTYAHIEKDLARLRCYRS